MFAGIVEQIKKHDVIILHRHERPDGDALGSQIGLKHIILASFPEKTVYCVGDGAGYLSFMEGSVMDEIPDSAFSHALSIILDTSSPHLIADKRYALAKTTARIDHHVFQERIADYELVDSSFESCCGLIAFSAVEYGLVLNSTAAQSLFTGLVTDSGRFRYDCVNARTFRTAATLRQFPFSTDTIYRGLYTDTYEAKKRKAHFILKIKFTPKNVAYIYTTASELKDLNMDIFTASRGMTNVMADIKGVDIWVNFTESDGGIICEMRSADKSINHIAVKYGGGGHAKAMALLQELDDMMGE